MRNRIDIELALSSVTKGVRALELQGFLRESILARLCLGGERLNRAVRHALIDLVNFDDELTATEYVVDVGDRSDHLFEPHGCDALEKAVLRYAVEQRLGNVAQPSSEDLQIPAFPSRKGGAPVTPRQAERAVVKGLTAAGCSEVMTFRSLRQLGSRLGLNKATVGAGSRGQPRKYPPAVSAAVDSAEWLFKRLFQHDVHAGEDARQEARFRVWKALSCASLDAAALKTVAEKTARACHRELNRDRQRCPCSSPRALDCLLNTAHRSTILVDRPHLRQRIGEALQILSYREREIIKLRFGLADGYDYTRQEVAHIFKLPPHQIAEIERTGIKRLKQRPGQLTGFLD